ncbi:MAG: outer membrane lipoprotein carrier protein LolA [Candidatus Cryptobacteroides sp.]
MKKIIMTIMLALSVSVANAGNDQTLNAVKTKCQQFKTLTATFAQAKVLVSGKEITSGGKLYFSAPDRMSMIYDNPEGDLFIIDGADLYMSKGKTAHLYDTKKNALMGSLSATLLHCVRGEIEELAEENDADVKTESLKGSIRVTITARKKVAKGYSSIILLYDAAASTLTKMELVEPNGIRNIYEMSSFAVNPPVDDAVYSYPKK